MSEGPLAFREATGSPINSSIVWTALTVPPVWKFDQSTTRFALGIPGFVIASEILA